jgi:hypothetical protein
VLIPVNKKTEITIFYICYLFHLGVEIYRKAYVRKCCGTVPQHGAVPGNAGVFIRLAENLYAKIILPLLKPGDKKFCNIAIEQRNIMV